MLRPVETGGWGLGGGPQILAKVDLLLTDSNRGNKKGAKKYKPYQIPQKLLVTLLLFT